MAQRPTAALLALATDATVCASTGALAQFTAPADAVVLANGGAAARHALRHCDPVDADCAKAALNAVVPAAPVHAGAADGTGVFSPVVRAQLTAVAGTARRSDSLVDTQALAVALWANFRLLAVRAQFPWASDGAWAADRTGDPLPVVPADTAAHARGALRTAFAVFANTAAAANFA